MLLKDEILKTYLKWRTYIGFIALAVFVPAVQVAMKFEGGGMVNRFTRGFQDDFLFLGNLFNGYFITLLLLNSLWVHIPFLITLVAGDQIAGESTGGTFRLTLIQPVSRSRILLTKYATTLFYSFTLVAFLALLSLGLGLFLFGSGPLIVPGRTITVLPQDQLIWRMLLAFGLATISMWCVASLAFLFSSLVENAIGPIVGTMAVIIVLLVLSNMPVDFFRAIKPYFFTTYLDVWQRVFDEPTPWQTIWKNLAIIVGHCIGFYAITWYIFVRKDILS